MAKKYVDIFKDSAETQYATGMLPLMGLAALNEGVEFVPMVPSQTRTANTAPQYGIQRLKRLKAGDAPSQTAKAGDDLVALYNTAQKVEWDTVDIKSAVKRALLVDTEKFDASDILEDASAFERTISNRVQNALFEAEELATGSVVGAGAKSALVVSSDDATVKDIQEKVTEIQLLVDDFKAYSEGVIVLVHPEVAKVFSRVQGQSYQTGTNTFPEGLGKGFRYDGIDYFVSPILNAIESSSGKVAGAVVLDKEAYANAGLTNSMVEFTDSLADKTIFGHTYHNLDAVVDADRIKVLEIAKPSANQSKKVSA